MKNKAKVCHVTTVHKRHDVRILHKQCISLSKEFDVTLLVNDNLPDEVKEGVKIKSTQFKPRIAIERLFLTSRKMKRMLLKEDADLYHFHDPELLYLAKLMKKRGKIVVFDFHENVPDIIGYKRWIPRIMRGIVKKIYLKIESTIVPKLDLIITVTPKFVERLSKLNAKCMMITNFPFYKNRTVDYEKKGKFICFAGGIIPQWQHHKIIEALNYFTDIKYILAGKADPDYLERLRKLDGWEKVVYKGIIPHEEVEEIYTESMIGMSILDYSTQVGQDGTLGNTKLFEIMEAGIPVICSNTKIWSKIIEENNCGITVDPNDVGSIVNAIEEIISKKEKAMSMGENGRSAVLDEYNWRTQEKKLLDAYYHILPK